MNASLLDRAPAYFDSQWRGSRSPWLAKTAGPFVTISRESGSGGSSLARILARLLNGEFPKDVFWNVFEGNLPARMLKEHHLPARIGRFLPEDHVSELNASVGELVGLHPSLWELVQKLNGTMQHLARGGHAILVGRGANFATAGIPQGVHVRLVAPARHRAEYRARLYDISEKEALAYNARCDAARRRYVNDTFCADVEDANAYDLTIDTSRVPLGTAARLIASLVHARVST